MDRFSTYTPSVEPAPKLNNFMLKNPSNKKDGVKTEEDVSEDYEDDEFDSLSKSQAGASMTKHPNKKSTTLAESD